MFNFGKLKFLYKSKNPYKYDCIATLSGGIDSTVIVHYLNDIGKHPLCVYVNYGAKAYKGEVRCSINTCKLLGFDYLEIPFKLYSKISECSIFSKAMKGKDDNAYFLEGRNGLICLIIAVLASKYNLDEVYIGSNADDLYKDTTLEFYNALNKVIEVGFEHKVRIVTPFLEKNMIKKDVILMGERFKINWTRDTHSCYDGSKTCCDYGHCVACKNRRDDFQKAGLADPFNVKYKHNI